MSHGRRIVLLLILLSLFSSSNEAATAAAGGGRGISSNPESEYDGGGGEWRSATATYFVRDATTASGRGGGGGGGSGACGFGDVEEMEPESDYGSGSSGSAAAVGVSVSGAVFEKGSRCGGCFEVRCVDHILWCLNGSPSVVVTVTDFCPPNYGLPGDSGGCCNHPREHFQMSLSAFSRIAKTTTNVDVIPVQYRRVQCKRAGGMRFTVTGSSYFFQVLVANVASAGEVAAVKVKGSRTGWMPLARNWGQNWQCEVDLHGQPLSFEVTDGRGRTVTSYNVAPANWEYGQAFQGKQFQH